MAEDKRTQQQTLQQERALHAWQQIETVNGSDKEYGSLVRGLPAMIQHDGLAPTLAFLKAKKKDHHLRVYNQLSAWFTPSENHHPPIEIKGDLLEYLIKNNSTSYRQITTEALAYLSWLKRFAEAKGLGDET
jgi:CRISPR-associated protein Cmr5